jgi:hypothetical protein
MLGPVIIKLFPLGAVWLNPVATVVVLEADPALAIVTLEIEKPVPPMLSMLLAPYCRAER